MQPPPSTPAEPLPRASERRRERVFTWPLIAFLLAVGAVHAASLVRRLHRPTTAEGVELLADGDLDARERAVALRAVLDGALRSDVPRERWAGLMAAVALEDRAAFATLRERLGGAAPAVLTPDEAEWLHLGDPMLGNVLRAMTAEVAADRDGARTAWNQVRALGRLTDAPFAAELAAAALQRLH